MKNYVIINGVNSNTITGLMINELPPITKPQMRAIQEEIDGRDGDITTNLGYSAYDKTITIGLFGTGYDINNIISFFNGEGTIVFSNEDDKYYNFKILNQIDYVALQKFKSASITFHCQPFKYPLTETPLEIEYSYVSDEGESISLNTALGEMKVNLLGNTSQHSTTGKNLANSSDNTFVFIANDNTTKTLGQVDLVAGTTYYYSYTINNATSSSTRNTPFLQILNGTRQYESAQTNYNATTGRKVWTYNCETTGTYDFGYWCHTPNVNLTVSDFMISTSSDTTYEPYTNGASPNPDYPQPVNVVSGDNEVVVTGKNLLPLTNQDFSIGDLHYSVNGGVLQATGSRNPEVQRNNNNFKSNFNFTLPAGTYTIKYTDKGTITGTQNFYIMKYSDDSEIQRIYATSNTFTLNEETKVYLGIYSYQLSITGTIEYEIMLESGSTATDFEPYQSTSYPVNLPVENLLGLTDGTYSDVGITAVVSNGEIVLNGTATANSFVVIDLLESISIGGTNHIVSLNNATAVSDSNTEVRLIDGSNYENIKLNVANNTRTLNNNRVYTKLQIRTSSGVSYNDYVIKPQLEKGTKANSFTPYGTTPIELCKIGTYQDKFIRNSGKQLWQGNKDYTGSGTVAQIHQTLAPGTYTASYKQSVNGTVQFNLKDSNGSLVQAITTYAIAGNSSATFTITSNEVSDIWLYLSVNMTVNDIMINEGSTALPYEPYGNGDWYKESKKRKVVFDGSEDEDWVSAGSYQRYTITMSDFTSPSSSSVANILCNKLIATSKNNVAFVDNAISGGDENNHKMFVRIDNTITTVALLRTFLSNNPLLVYYQLSTPTYTPITGTLKEELEAVWRAYSYNGTTNISQVNNDKAFILNVEAMEEGSNEVQVNNIGNTYSKPLIALEGTGNINIYLDNTQILQANVEDKMNIDIAKLEAYNPDTSVLLNRQVIGNYNSMTIPSGTSIIRMDGELTKATITNYTRWL